MAPSRRSLCELTLARGTEARTLADEAHRVVLADLIDGTNVEAPLESLRGCSVLLVSDGQLPTVLAAIALDGIAARLLLCLSDIAVSDLSGIVAEGAADAIVSDGTGPQPETDGALARVRCGSAVRPGGARGLDRSTETEWILFTSGTTGRPKMVSHTLSSLTGPLDDGLQVSDGAVWSTFYDVRRYGGLQILLRALLGGGSMVLSSACEPVGDFLVRAGRNGVTHISGTPSHWRRALMSPAAGRMTPRYVRLSGEVADQAILDHLKQAYPQSDVAHAFASTEAGVAFDVRDGLAGFPASYIGQLGAKAEMRVVDGTLRIRSARAASRYLGAASRLGDDEGFIDTGDMVERRGDRYYFIGRREGVINIGGQKVHPEEVEAVINRHPGVRMSRVWARKSPITGSIVAAEVVPRDPADSGAAFTALRDAILQTCRQVLPPHKVPVSMKAVDSLAVGPSGKLLRHGP
jgi:acyl-CoA synthetase (AMP-forming)/AMP-acid ligase II